MGQSNLAKGDIAHYGGVHLDPQFWGKGRSYGVSDGTIQKSDGGFLQVLHCDHCAISNHSAEVCRGMSPTLKSTGVGHFGTKFVKEYVE